MATRPATAARAAQLAGAMLTLQRLYALRTATHPRRLARRIRAPQMSPPAALPRAA